MYLWQPDINQYNNLKFLNLVLFFKFHNRGHGLYKNANWKQGHKNKVIKFNILPESRHFPNTIGEFMYIFSPKKKNSLWMWI